MTYAPPCIGAARSYLLSRGLPANGVGIVGDPDHAASGGYHEGNDDLSRVGRLNTDYSKRESPRDRPGSNAAAALDVGGLNGIELARFSKWLVAQCIGGAPDTLNIREVIYYDPAANAVRRWDRLGVRSGGDSSHRYHTHISYFRNSEGQDKTAVLRRYFEGGAATASTASAQAQGVDDVALTPEEWRNIRNPNEMLYGIATGAAKLSVQLPTGFVDVENKPQAQLDRIEAALKAPAPVAVDAATLAAALADPAFLAAVAKAVLDAEAARLAG